jgi:hypothetical protein
MALDHVQHVTVWCRFFGAPLPLHGLEKKNSPLLSLGLDPKHHIHPDVLLEIRKTVHGSESFAVRFLDLMSWRVRTQMLLYWILGVTGPAQ